MSAEWSTTAAPTFHADRIQTVVSQWLGSPMRMRLPGAASRSSTRKLLVLATQFAVVVVLSSTRSPVAMS